MFRNMIQNVFRSIILFTLFSLCACQSNSVIVTERVKSATPMDATETALFTSTATVIRVTNTNTVTPTLPTPSKTATRTIVPSRTPTITLTLNSRIIIPMGA